MKLTFSNADIEAMLITKAREMGLEANQVRWSGPFYAPEAEVSMARGEFQPLDIREAA